MQCRMQVEGPHQSGWWRKRLRLNAGWRKRLEGFKAMQARNFPGKLVDYEDFVVICWKRRRRSLWSIWFMLCIVAARLPSSSQATASSDSCKKHSMENVNIVSLKFKKMLGFLKKLDRRKIARMGVRMDVIWGYKFSKHSCNLAY